MGIFNGDFYPTPDSVIESMTFGLDLYNKVVLEPSVGSGAIVDYLYENTGVAEVIGCEIDETIRYISESKCRIIEHDFIKVKSNQISHVNFIIMNPPFSADEKHVLHAWDIAPAGCEIVAIINQETLKNAYTNRRRELTSVIKEYGSTTPLGRCFMDAERVTDVEIVMIKLQKPKDDFEGEFEGFFMTEDEEAEFDGIRPYDKVRDIVGRYVGAIRIFDKQIESARELSDLTEGVFNADVREGGERNTKIALLFTEKQAKEARETYKKELQKSAWKWVIDKMNLKKYVTKGVKDDINKFVESQKQYPFTMKNIYQMMYILQATVSNRMDKAMLEVFEALTKHYSENRYSVEGWKTNSNYLVNEKFILPSVFGDNYAGDGENFRVPYDNARAESLDDLVKALCYINAIDYNNHCTLRDFLRQNVYARYKTGELVVLKNGYGNYEIEGVSGWRCENEIERFKITCRENGWVFCTRPEWGKWFDFGFFEIKGFKKGTAHIRFKSRDMWASFNQAIARIKGFPLPDMHDDSSKKRNEKARKAHMKK